MVYPSKRREWVVAALDATKSPRPWLQATPSVAKRSAVGRRHKPRRRNRRTVARRVPCAPYNTTSYLMRAGKLGIDAPLVSPATLALDTPVASPAAWACESPGDCKVANELGVNAYGSMNGRIRLRSEDLEQGSGWTSCGESDTEQCGRRPAESVQQVEERIDHGLQRFEMLYNPNSPPRRHGAAGDQETLIEHLEEENLALQQRLWALSQELSRLRRRVGDGGECGAVSEESLGSGSCAS